MRVDAQQNRGRLVEAAIEVILEVGGAPSRESIAARAGVGIGTLYRHFPNQEDLLQAVAHHVLHDTINAGENAMTHAENGAAALRQYMHLAIDHGLGVLNIIYGLLESAQWPEQRERAESLLRAIVDRARSEGLLRSDVTASDVGFAIIRSCRPLGVGIPLEEERALAHRHVDIHVDGLLAPEGR